MAEGTLWSRKLSDEFWAGVVSPLMFSIAGELIESHMIGKGMKLTGMNQFEGIPMVRLFNGQVYINCDYLEAVLKLIPTALITEEVLEMVPEEIRDRLSLHHEPFFSKNFLKTVVRLFTVDKHWHPFSNYKEFETKSAEIEKVMRVERERDLGSMTLAELIDYGDSTRATMGEFLDIVTWSMVFAYVFLPLTQILADKWGGDRKMQHSPNLTIGLDGVKTFEVNEKIEALSRIVDRSPSLKAIFSTYPSDRILSKLREKKEASGFLEEFEVLLETHGHRLIGRDVIFPTWREAPEIVVDLIKKGPRSRMKDDSQSSQKALRLESTEIIKRNIRKKVFGSLKASLFSMSLSFDQRYIIIRENMRYYSDMFLEVFRRTYLAIGSRLSEKGAIDSREDIFYLTKEEIIEIADNGMAVKTLVKKRAADYEEYLKTRSTEVIREGEESFAQEAPSRSHQTELTGQIASRGSVSARARVILDPKNFPSFESGEILVTLYTDPSWTSLLAHAGGLILEVGGLLSHGSIVAREYGLPAMINVQDATRLIKTGDFIHLDAERGVIIVDSSGDPS